MLGPSRLLPHLLFIAQDGILFPKSKLWSSQEGHKGPLSLVLTAGLCCPVGSLRPVTPNLKASTQRHHELSVDPAAAPLSPLDLTPVSAGPPGLWPRVPPWGSLRFPHTLCRSWEIRNTMPPPSWHRSAWCLVTHCQKRTSEQRTVQMLLGFP